MLRAKSLVSLINETAALEDAAARAQVGQRDCVWVAAVAGHGTCTLAHCFGGTVHAYSSRRGP
jgi:hypothetical protein